MDGFVRTPLEYVEGGEGASFSVERYKIVTSTMDIMDKRIARGLAFDGLFALAAQQLNGRGSGGRTWISPVGNAYFSRATEVLAHEYGQTMEMMAACAVTEILRELLPLADVRYKYPNDILVNGKKIAGCLVSPIYDVITGHDRLVDLGVGINIARAPHLVGKETTCLADEGISTIQIDDILKRFEHRFHDIRHSYRISRDFNKILDRMGFLDLDGQLTLHMPVQCVWRGSYAGFKTYMMDGQPTAWLLLESGGQIYRHKVHTFDIGCSPPCRSAFTPLLLPHDYVR